MGSLNSRNVSGTSHPQDGISRGCGRLLGGLEIPASLCDPVLEMMVTCSAIISDESDILHEKPLRSALNLLQEKHPLTRSRVEFVTRDNAQFVPLSVEEAAADLAIVEVDELHLPSIIRNLARPWDPKQNVNLRYCILFPCVSCLPICVCLCVCVTFLGSFIKQHLLTRTAISSHFD